MKVSVIIPVYRRQQEADVALRSVIQQDGVDFEVIVVDDGSPEPYRVPLDCAHDPRVRLIRLSRNAGAAAARNRGISEATSPWIAFLDSDDIWLPGKLARQVAFAEDGMARGWPSLTSVATGFRRLELATGATAIRIPVASADPADFASGCWFGPGSTALVPREAFARVGLLDERLERLEDLDWFLRLALAGGGVAVVDAVEVEVRVGGRPSRDRLDRAASILSEKWLARGAAHRLPQPLRRNMAAYLAIEKASTRYFSGDLGGCVRALAHSWLLRPRFRLHLQRWWLGSERASPNG